MLCIIHFFKMTQNLAKFSGKMCLIFESSFESLLICILDCKGTAACQVKFVLKYITANSFVSFIR